MGAMRFLRLLVVVGFGWGMQVGMADAAQDLVVVDEDWNVPGDFICECNLPLLLVAPQVKVLALTAVTGDAWRDEGVANILRFLEEIGRTDIPVAKGAVFPLINTRERLARWEGQFGPLSWKGAWNSPEREKGAHPDAPFAIRLAREGAPRHAAVAESAVTLMIRLVREHPHQVTFIAGGPLTNLALAVRQDPEFASLAKRLILGDVQVRDLIAGKAPTRPRFNEVFDPEAAHIVLTAGWREIVCFDPVKGSYPMVEARLLARIQEHPSAASNYLAKNTGFGTPLWAAEEAFVGDPSLIQGERKVRARLDVGLEDDGPLLGSAMLAPAEGYAGPAGGAALTIITDFDWGGG
jgi:purine nucleosidase